MKVLSKKKNNFVNAWFVCLLIFGALFASIIRAAEHVERARRRMETAANASVENCLRLTGQVEKHFDGVLIDLMQAVVDPDRMILSISPCVDNIGKCVSDLNQLTKELADSGLRIFPETTKNNFPDIIGAKGLKNLETFFGRTAGKMGQVHKEAQSLCNEIGRLRDVYGDVVLKRNPSLRIKRKLELAKIRGKVLNLKLGIEKLAAVIGSRDVVLDVGPQHVKRGFVPAAFEEIEQADQEIAGEHPFANAVRHGLNCAKKAAPHSEWVRFAASIAGADDKYVPEGLRPELPKTEEECLADLAKKVHDPIRGDDDQIDYTKKIKNHRDGKGSVIVRCWDWIIKKADEKLQPGEGSGRVLRFSKWVGRKALGATNGASCWTARKIFGAQRPFRTSPEGKVAGSIFRGWRRVQSEADVFPGQNDERQNTFLDRYGKSTLLGAAAIVASSALVCRKIGSKRLTCVLNKILRKKAPRKLSRLQKLSCWTKKLFWRY